MDLSRPLTVVSPTVDADVLAALAGAEASFTGRQVHRIIGRHSERGVRNALHRLSEQGVVNRERVGPSDRYTLNRAHLAAPHIEALARLRAEFLQRVSARIETWALPAELAALFGSAARGDMRPDSDIDLLVVRPDDVDADDERWRDQLSALAEDVTAWTGNDTRILELGATEAEDGEPALARISDEAITLFGPSSYLRMKTQRTKRGRRDG